MEGCWYVLIDQLDRVGVRKIEDRGFPLFRDETAEEWGTEQYWKALQWKLSREL
jgi:hypothetical protein